MFCLYVFPSFYVCYYFFFFLMIRRPPRSTLDRSSAASDVYKRQAAFLPFHTFSVTKSGPWTLANGVRLPLWSKLVHIADRCCTVMHCLRPPTKRPPDKGGLFNEYEVLRVADRCSFKQQKILSCQLIPTRSTLPEFPTWTVSALAAFTIHCRFTLNISLRLRQQRTAAQFQPVSYTHLTPPTSDLV